ncbi:AbrB/MazE/SpoVT family DNA-binding domain-containing protein [Sphingomonas sp.]|jgi:antitoxin VapB|uniref:antitoxin n=1 Tax=Sphingomonas sp. TaxID=28214 RepID=UPI002DBE8A80|nr:AbrB/MazE/SpoVT family DNA-binding domain-containing protein [Sphingomonas sp.]HEU4967575.1 AbrB/MazE/SpoVT family DNA-binding domain-containing protein [Sphingomonas sp.]
MGYERHVKFFRNGRNKAVRIPREFELPGDEAIMRKEGDRLIIEPAPRRRTLREAIDWLRTQPPLRPEDDFPEIEDPPPDPVDL